MPDKLRVTLVKSPISHKPANRATVRALGLRRIGDSIVIDDTPPLRGMLRAVRFLLRTEVVDEPAAGERKTKAKATR